MSRPPRREQLPAYLGVMLFLCGSNCAPRDSNIMQTTKGNFLWLKKHSQQKGMGIEAFLSCLRIYCQR